MKAEKLIDDVRADRLSFRGRALTLDNRALSFRLAELLARTLDKDQAVAYVTQEGQFTEERVGPSTTRQTGTVTWYIVVDGVLLIIALDVNPPGCTGTQRISCTGLPAAELTSYTLTETYQGQQAEPADIGLTLQFVSRLVELPKGGLELRDLLTALKTTHSRK